MDRKFVLSFILHPLRWKSIMRVPPRGCVMCLRVQLTRSYLLSRSVHGSRRVSQFTTHTTTFRSYRSTDLFSSYLRRPLRYSHRPSHNTHPENQSIDSQTIRSNYNTLQWLVLWRNQRCKMLCSVLLHFLLNYISSPSSICPIFTGPES